MRMNFDNLTDSEKYDLVETYLENKKEIKTMDIVTVCSMFGVSMLEAFGFMFDDEALKFAPLVTLPLFAYMAYKKIKLSKKYKKVTSGKVNYAKLRRADFNGELKQLTIDYSRRNHLERILDVLTSGLGITREQLREVNITKSDNQTYSEEKASNVSKEKNQDVENNEVNEQSANFEEKVDVKEENVEQTQAPENNIEDKIEEEKE